MFSRFLRHSHSTELRAPPQSPLMSGFFRFFSLEYCIASAALVFGLLGCSACQAPHRTAESTDTATAIAPAAPPAPVVTPAPIVVYPVMLGIDDLESQAFAPIKRKRVG